MNSGLLHHLPSFLGGLKAVYPTETLLPESGECCLEKLPRPKRSFRAAIGDGRHGIFQVLVLEQQQKERKREVTVFKKM